MEWRAKQARPVREASKKKTLQNGTRFFKKLKKYKNLSNTFVNMHLWQFFFGGGEARELGNCRYVFFSKVGGGLVHKEGREGKDHIVIAFVQFFRTSENHEKIRETNCVFLTSAQKKDNSPFCTTNGKQRKSDWLRENDPCNTYNSHSSNTYVVKYMLVGTVRTVCRWRRKQTRSITGRFPLRDPLSPDFVLC